VYFNISITSQELQTSRLGFVSAGEANVSVSFRSQAFTSRAHPCRAYLICIATITMQYKIYNNAN